MDAAQQASRWRKSTRSNQETNCVEVGTLAGGGAAVRDTKHRDLGYITTTPHQWATFIKALKEDRF